MSETKLLDNKQLVHIVCEGVILLGMAYYFSSKNKQLSTQIEELSQRLEDQEDKFQKALENMNAKLDSYAQQTGNSLMQCMQNVNMLTEKIKPDKKQSSRKHTTPFMTEQSRMPIQSRTPVQSRTAIPREQPVQSGTPVQSRKVQPKVQFDEPEQSQVIQLEDDQDDSDLDDEIRQELDEISEDDSSLKKEM